MRLLLSVAQERDGDWRDLDLPSDRPLHELLPLLVGLVVGEQSSQEWELWAAPPARELQLGQTLAEAGVWSGSWLLLRPQ